jgi:hypothetical protein
MMVGTANSCEPVKDRAQIVTPVIANSLRSAPVGEGDLLSERTHRIR